MVDSIADLRRRTDEELIAAHDALAPHTVVGTGYYVEELARRENARTADRIEQLTERVTRLTWVITILTALNVVVACVSTYAVLR
jgi:hypothetical protein